MLAMMMACEASLRDAEPPTVEQEGSPRLSEGGSTLAFAGTGALLASRFHSLAEFKSLVQVEYASNGDVTDTSIAVQSQVKLTHRSHGEEVVGILASGLSQEDIMNAKKEGFWGRVGLLYSAPYPVANRADLERVLTFARRIPLTFGEGDPAFLDLAQTSVANINTPNLAFLTALDTSEKGYLNTFNHITAQAFITTIFSEELADVVADLHERKNMPELTTGRFTAAQLSNPDNNPVENYVDIVNNEWGQELGKRLRDRYQITRKTHWSPTLLADYLNEVQAYYSWAFGIGFQPFRPEDELMLRFTSKLNLVMGDGFGL